MGVYWHDFAILGAFLFLLSLIWVFQASFQKYAHLIKKEKNESQPEKNVQTGWVEGIVSCIVPLVVLFTELKTSRYNADDIEHREEDKRKFLLIVWLPIAIYGGFTIAREFISSICKRFLRPLLIIAFLCEFALVSSHIQSLPPGTDKTMYTPIYLLIYFSALVILAEMLIPEMGELRFLSCGCTLMRGTWYSQVGFTLCMTGREWKSDESVGITVLLVFLWHGILSWIVIRVMQNTIKAVLLDQPWLEDEDFEEYQRHDHYPSKGKRRLVSQQEPVQLTKEQLQSMTWAAQYMK